MICACVNTVEHILFRTVEYAKNLLNCEYNGFVSRSFIWKTELIRQLRKKRSGKFQKNNSPDFPGHVTWLKIYHFRFKCKQQMIKAISVRSNMLNFHHQLAWAFSTPLHQWINTKTEQCNARQNLNRKWYVKRKQNKSPDHDRYLHILFILLTNILFKKSPRCMKILNIVI